MSAQHILAVRLAELVCIVAAASNISSSAAHAVAQLPSVFQATLEESNQRTAELSTDELRQALRDGTSLVFDSRPHMEFAVSHIPGALNVAPKPGMAMSQYVSDVAEIGRVAPDPTTQLVLYCNGPFCGKSKRLGEELVEAGYTNVRRYQLGAPTWRALVGVMQIEMDGVRYVWEGDRTAVFVDARPSEDFAAGSLPGSRNIPLSEVSAAKDDGRLPMEDHNTRVVVFGGDTQQARIVAAELAKNAFHNVAFFDGTPHDIVAGLNLAMAPTNVEGAVPAQPALAMSAQARDKWYLEAAHLTGAPAMSTQARDRWYLEPPVFHTAPANSVPVRDAWYRDRE
jgi:rhodanese-related sulfurtransferase